MSTKGSTYYDDEPDTPMDWTVTPKSWCPSCCVPLDSCGCPIAERLLDELRAQHLDGMGVE